MKNIRWEFIPFAGFIITFVRYLYVTYKYEKNPTWENNEATWDIGGKCFIAMLSMFVGLLIAVMIFAIDYH